MVKKYNRIKSQQHVHLYKVQPISVTYGSVYILSPLSLLTICCTDATAGKSRWLSGNMLV